MHIPDTLRQQLKTQLFYDESGCIDRIVKALVDLGYCEKRILVVCDHNTRRVAADRIFKLISEASLPVRLYEFDRALGEPLPADYGIVAQVKEEIESGEYFPVAVGAGTINDIVKRASYESNTPYLCVPTASSIDGYCSSGAALVKNGLKSTLDCPPPVGIIADPDILKTAPKSMTSSGYGDLYAKLAAGMDWLFADRLGVEAIEPAVWELVQQDLPSWISHPAGLFDDGSPTFTNLFKGLTLSGFAMQLYHDSRPASGAEHMISHIWEMEHLSFKGLHVSHGFKVALGTVITTALMERLFAMDLQNLDVEKIVRSRPGWAERSAQIAMCFPQEPLQGTIMKICQRKWPNDAQLASRMERLRSNAAELADIFTARLGSSTSVKDHLQQAGCPTSLSDLGIDAHRLHPTLVKAHMIRQRYTILDVLYESGLFDSCVGGMTI